VIWHNKEKKVEQCESGFDPEDLPFLSSFFIMPSKLKCSSQITFQFFSLGLLLEELSWYIIDDSFNSHHSIPFPFHQSIY